MVSISTDDVGEVVKDGSKWITAQSFNNVLLMLILVFGGAFSFYVVAYAVPKHIESIKSGYKELSADHKDSVEKVVGAFREERERNDKLIQELVLQRK